MSVSCRSLLAILLTGIPCYVPALPSPYVRYVLSIDDALKRNNTRRYARGMGYDIFEYRSFIYDIMIRCDVSISHELSNASTHTRFTHGTGYIEYNTVFKAYAGIMKKESDTLRLYKQ